MRKALQVKRSRAEELGATTAEYAVCTGAAVGFGGLLFKILTSGPGQEFLTHVWDRVASLLPF
ncbi:MAG: DUF4244 domain-containing protein [Marmoricola sp.]